MPVNTYITANGRIRRRITTNGGAVTDQVAVVTNALGSVIATYKDGWLTADRSYDPYGETRAEWNDVGRFGWVGGLGYRETRREWVSHYVRARHYGFPMGMWTSVDPLWPSEAAFGYVGGRTTRDVDPDGLQTFNLGLEPCPFSNQRPCSDLLRGKRVPPEIFALINCLKAASGHAGIQKCLSKHKKVTSKMWKEFGPYISCMVSHVESGPGPGLDPCNPPDVNGFGQECCYQEYIRCVLGVWAGNGRQFHFALLRCKGKFEACGFSTAHDLPWRPL